MTRCALNRVVILASILSASAPLLSQFSERIEVRLHQLDVVVERRDGTPVTDLQKEDFEVRQDGVVQPITNFSLITESTAEDRIAPGAKQEQHVEQARPRPPRKFVFFVDEFPMHDATRADILRQAGELVESMNGNDEAMVITPAAREHIPLLFTADKKAVMSMLERVTKQMMRKEDVRNLDANATGDEEFLLRGDCSQSLYACAKRRLGTLRSIAGALGQVPGKKVLVLLAMRMTSVPGLNLQPSRPMAADPRDPRGTAPIVPDFRDLQRLTADAARVAAASNVLIYGLESYEPGSSALSGMSVEVAAPTYKRASERGEGGAQDLLRTLAEATGTRAYSGTRDSGKMFEQISSDLSSYYSIAYREIDPNRRSTHRVEVRVRNRPDLVVRARRSVSAKDEKQETPDRALSALLTSNPPNPLSIGVRASPLIRRGRQWEMPLEIRVPINRLTFAHEAKGYRSRFIVLVAAVGTHADFGSTQLEHEQELLIPEEKWAKSQQEHFTFNIAVRLKPGRYRIAVGVTDIASRESGFQAFRVTSP